MGGGSCKNISVSRQTSHRSVWPSIENCVKNVYRITNGYTGSFAICSLFAFKHVSRTVFDTTRTRTTRGLGRSVADKDRSFPLYIPATVSGRVFSRDTFIATIYSYARIVPVPCSNYFAERVVRSHADNRGFRLSNV